MVITGTPNDDRNLNGTSAADVISGLAGNDRIFALDGDDEVDGGDGNDELAAGNGLDTLRGGNGNDQLFSRTTDMVEGSDDGANLMFGDAGNDEITGGNGNDTIFGGTGADTIDGSAGDDLIDGGPGADLMAGGAGNDRYTVDDLADRVIDGEGNSAGIIKVDFFKPTTGVTWTVDSGVKPLPYWIDTLVFQNVHAEYVNPVISTRVIKYAFPTEPLSGWDAEDRNGFIPINDAQKAAIAKIFAHVSTIADIRFELVSDPNQPGVLTFGNNSQKDSSGYAYGGPTTPVWSVLMDINSEGNLDPKEGNRGALVFVHEIGHAIGLKHPHSKNGGEVKSEDAEGPFLSDTEDQTRFTMLSYTESEDDYVFVFRDLDIAALQYLYGPAKVAGTAAHQTGNNAYVLNETTRNFIWDGGGTDTLDASSGSKRVVLSLEVGSHSYFGDAASNFITAAGQITINIGTQIENAIGTAFADILGGNAADNRLQGLAGNDAIDGLAGLDFAIFTGSRTSYEVTRSGGTVTVRDLRAQGDGTDTLTGIERLQFTDGLMGLVPERLVVLLPGARDLLSWDTTLGSNGFVYLTKLTGETNVAAVGDLTGDGRADLLLQQSDGGLLRWDLTQGGNGFAALAAAPGFTVLAAGDLIGTDAADILLRSASGGLRILDAVTNTISDLFTIAQGWSFKGLGNINGSGKSDIVIQNDTSGAVIAFTDAGWRDLITLAPSSGWQIAGLGDVVGGLADDFIFRNPTSGVYLFWDVTQGGQGFRDFATIAQGWNLLTISDLGGDGRDDVVFQNTNGLAVYWSGTNWVDLGSTLAGTQLQGTGMFA